MRVSPTNSLMILFPPPMWYCWHTIPCVRLNALSFHTKVLTFLDDITRSWRWRLDAGTPSAGCCSWQESRVSYLCYCVLEEQGRQNAARNPSTQEGRAQHPALVSLICARVVYICRHYTRALRPLHPEAIKSCVTLISRVVIHATRHLYVWISLILSLPLHSVYIFIYQYMCQ